MESDTIISLDLSEPVWPRVFLVAPLVVIGTREGDGYNLAPKHMASPLGLGHFFGFVCGPSHGTYHNAKEAGSFTVSYPRPEQLTMASLTAAERQPGTGAKKPVLKVLPTRPAERVDGVFLEGAYLMLECELHDIYEDLGSNSLVMGRVVAAHAREDALVISDADHQERIAQAPLLAYLSPGRFAEIRETRAFPFPADFKH